MDYSTLFGRLAELLDVGVLILDEEQSLQFTSLKARSLIGCSEESLEECWEDVWSAVEDTFSGNFPEEGLECEVTFNQEDRHHHLVLEAHALNEENCTGYLVLIQNHAELDSIETDLRLATQFRNTQRLYRALAHNLRHPVTTVLIRIDLLKNTLDGSGSQSADLQLRSLDTIKQEVQQLDQTLSMLLEEMSPADAEQSIFSLRKLISNIARLVEPQARQQGVALEVSLPDEEVNINGWRSRLKQALMNLSVNALEAMANGGKLRLALAVEDETARILVEDNGPGIPQEVRERMFESRFTTKKTGTGIGLYLVKETVKQHGGSINVDTEVDRGTTFHLALPLPREAAASTD